jgi:hypothetical protein
VAFTVCNDSLFVATSRNFLLRHNLAGDSSTGAPARSLARTHAHSCGAAPPALIVLYGLQCGLAMP